MRGDFYIETDWLETARGSVFFYPGAGSDISEALAVFRGHVNEFWFCDIAYPRSLELSAACTESADFRLVGRELSGSPMAEMEQRNAEGGRSYRFLRPSKLIETYERGNGPRLTIVRRRGFAQIALSEEFAVRSIGVFMHRGDSSGEAGSNIYFLANKKRNYEPCANLFAKLGHCLRDRALIISDGSNTSVRQLRHFHRCDIESGDAFSYHQGREFTFGGFVWTCVGWLGQRYGPTLVWGVTRQDSSYKSGS